jgi:hypothetical protein
LAISAQWRLAVSVGRDVTGTTGPKPHHPDGDELGRHDEIRREPGDARGQITRSAAPSTMTGRAPMKIASDRLDYKFRREPVATLTGPAPALRVVETIAE